MKKIIVPIDFSEHSEYALKAAARLAKEKNSEILALHMLEMSDTVFTDSDNLQSEKAAFFLKLAEKRFTEFLDKPFLEGLTVTPLVKQFKVFREVNDVANDHAADMIVMGSHGVRGAKEFFVGSNTEKVVRYADIPVLVVKDDLESVNFKTAVYATDFSPESVRSYTEATSLLESLGIQMKLLFVNLPKRFKSSYEMRKQAANFLKKADGNDNNIKNVAYRSEYSAEQGIFNYAEEIDADLIIVATHGRKGISHFFAGSIGEDVANHSDLPVLTFKIK